MAQQKTADWGHPGVIGLAGFGFTTALLQLHNLGMIDSVIPLMCGFFWGGAAQIIAGVIDGKRGDTFGMTAFVSYGFFWVALSFSFLLQWIGLVTLDNPGLGWLMICWGIFTMYMGIAAFRVSYLHVIIFWSLVVLFFLLAAHFLAGMPSAIAGAEGMVCALCAVYGSAAVILKEKFGRWVLPIGILPRVKEEAKVLVGARVK